MTRRTRAPPPLPHPPPPTRRGASRKRPVAFSRLGCRRVAYDLSPLRRRRSGGETRIASPTGRRCPAGVDAGGAVFVEKTTPRPPLMFRSAIKRRRREAIYDHQYRRFTHARGSGGLRVCRRYRYRNDMLHNFTVWSHKFSPGAICNVLRIHIIVIDAC